MKIYIPNIDLAAVPKKQLFILVRPFWSPKGWSNSGPDRMNFQMEESWEYTANPKDAQVLFLPNPIQQYTQKERKAVDAFCEKYQLKGYGYIAGDFGEDYGNYTNIICFRMGGFKSQLGKQNRGFPVPLSDHFQRIYKTTEIEGRNKTARPLLGFCGHASGARSKQVKEWLKCVRENGKRFWKNPLRKDYEPLFASAFERYTVLQYLESDARVQTNFIYRTQYRAGAQTEEQRTQTTLEYYDNIKNSDYVVCMRGAGNFSVRLYETLMMGRIPIIVNTDGLWPFEEAINWKEHAVWVEWNERQTIVEKVIHFHQAYSDEEFKALQQNNRRLWKETLSVQGILKRIQNDI